MTKEYTYQDLFEGEKFGLDSVLRDGVDYEAFRGLRMLLLLSHNQINKLEARIAELEKQMNQPIDIEQMIKDDFEVVFSGKPDVELSDSQKELKKLISKEFATARPTTLDKLELQAETTSPKWFGTLAKKQTDKFTREHDNLPVSEAITQHDSGRSEVVERELQRLAKLQESVDRAEPIVMGYVPDDFR